MIKPRLHHVTIKTSHLDEMIAWYSLVLGVEVQFRDQVAAWTHVIAWMGLLLRHHRLQSDNDCRSCWRRRHESADELPTQPPPTNHQRRHLRVALAIGWRQSAVFFNGPLRVPRAAEKQ